MNRYLTLDLDDKEDALYFGKKFLGDRHKWKMKIRKKQDELDTISELPAMSNSEVHSGHITKPTERAAMARIKIQEDIKRYLDYESILNYGLTHISPEDRELIEAFHFSKGKMLNAVIDEIAIKRDCSSRYIYKQRRNAILNFVDAIREIINE